MNYISALGSKLKGTSVSASGKHVDRTVQTPNADPEKSADNIHLVGENVPLEESVQEIINQHGGKPRSDSVECLEFILTASPKFFEKSDGKPDLKKVKAFAHASMTFINDDSNCGKCVKAVLHLDEMTPHIHVHKVPIDPNGKLNCKYYFGSKAQGRKFQDEMYEIYKHLGLERGIPNSRAEHFQIRDFYKELKKKFDLSIDLKKLPEPPRTMLLDSARDEYKNSVAQAVLLQLEPKFRVMNFQATQARNEKSRREALEQQFQDFKQVAGKIQQNWQRKSQVDTDRSQKLAKILEFREKEVVQLREQLTDKDRQNKIVRDIPAHEILQKFGVPLEEVSPNHYAYTGKKKDQNLLIADNKIYDVNGKVIAGNALETAKLIRQTQKLTLSDKQQENLECGKLLARLFGEPRAEAAMLYGYQEIHREGIKNYELAVEKAEIDKMQQSHNDNRQPNRESQLKTQDKNKDRDWNYSR